jgi:hypothetical protein
MYLMSMHLMGVYLMGVHRLQGTVDDFTNPAREFV